MNPQDIVEIIPHLYISNWDTSNNPEMIYNYNITGVITLESTPKPNSILNYYQNNNIQNMYIYIGDSPQEDISQYFDSTYDFIKNHIDAGGNVLVHCMAGISRSSSIILNYIMRNMYENGKVKTCPCKLFEDVLDYARQQRPIINPNHGFKKQLLQKAVEYQQEIDRQINQNTKQRALNIY